MNEEQISKALFLAADEDSDLAVLSWQGVDGKGYFAADVKLRLKNGLRVEPDLIVALEDDLWLIEVKDSHSAAVADELKLRELVEDLGESSIRRQVELRCGVTVPERVVLAVAYYGDNYSGDACLPEIVHLAWRSMERGVKRDGLASVLMEIER